jgi:hypothetical protein
MNLPVAHSLITMFWNEDASRYDLARKIRFRTENLWKVRLKFVKSNRNLRATGCCWRVTARGSFFSETWVMSHSDNYLQGKNEACGSPVRV